MPEWHGAVGRESVSRVGVGRHEQDKDFIAQEISCGVDGFFCALTLENVSALICSTVSTENRQ